MQQAAVEIDYAADEARRKDANAAVVEQVDASRIALGIIEDRVVAEVRIAVDDSVMAERRPPGGEHGSGEPVTRGELIVLVLKHLPAREPIHRQQTAGGKLGPYRGHADSRAVLQHDTVKRDVLGLAHVVELLAQAFGDFFRDLGGVDRRIEALADRKQQPRFPEIAFARRLHFWILELAGQFDAVERAGAVHLAERGGRRRVMLETLEFLFPADAELRIHPSPHEGPAHGWRLALQFGEFGGVLRW